MDFKENIFRKTVKTKTTFSTLVFGGDNFVKNGQRIIVFDSCLRYMSFYGPISENFNWKKIWKGTFNAHFGSGNRPI